MKNTTTLHSTPCGGFVMFTEDANTEPGIENNYSENNRQEPADWEFYPDTSF